MAAKKKSGIRSGSMSVRTASLTRYNRKRGVKNKG